jgi:drug/metabolite transporter (DMT)-like permease
VTRRHAIYALWGACLIWGAAFPLAKLALADASPMAFTSARFLLAALLLLPVLRDITPEEWRWGGMLGALLALGFATQTIGLDYTTASRSGFLTALYIPFTPLIVLLVFRTLPGLAAGAGLVLALSGMVLLTGPAAFGGGFNRGDLLTVICAVAFAAHMVLTSSAARRGRGERLMAAQVVVAAGLTTLATPMIETPRLSPTPLLLGVVVFEAVLASLVAIRLQLAAQRILSPTYSALVFTLEPVIASAMSYVLTGDRLVALQWAGGALIVAGSLLPDLTRLQRRAPA